MTPMQQIARKGNCFCSWAHETSPDDKQGNRRACSVRTAGFKARDAVDGSDTKDGVGRDDGATLKKNTTSWRRMLCLDSIATPTMMKMR
jgi:hypothetical protein